MSKDKMSPGVVAAADQVLAEYLDDPDIILFDQSAARKAQFGGVASLANARRTPRTCMYPSCAATTIRHSHTIPRSSSIAAIANRGHVVTPAFSHPDGKMVARLVGTQCASAFPGFCETHEGLFFSYERTGRIMSELDISRQLFRSICREVVRFEIEGTWLEQTLRDFDEFRRVAIERLIRQRAGDESVSVSSVDAKGPRADLFQSRLDELREELAWFRREFYSAAAAGVDDAEQSGLAVSAIEIDRVVPVCLSGRANFHFRTADTVVHNVRVVVTVIPTPPNTFVAIAAPKAYGHMLDAYAAIRFSNPLMIIAAIESWMLHGTDHWFLGPDTWSSITPTAQQALLDDILDDTHNIGALYNKTVFNALKRDILAKIRSSLGPAELVQLEQTIAPWTDTTDTG
ncbi:hypothetical protein [Polyangium sp. 6x1]|uniref:hypothetical protein n=1 Tax=Polyangium sp. 6x1 TaxID=3042689 RepID=UPI0024826B19|nr:hypothetical protein [Polyangium sp. 6x1]MDI1444861.1 hypothetical protein [Polyangium sp. 6x1]